MRALFAKLLFEEMEWNSDVYVLTGDLGYIMFDKIRDNFPNRFINVGAAEQCMLDMAVGLALSGKIPIVYSITPFLLYRGFETIRTYINYQNIGVKLIGSGRGKDYLHDGFSHWADDDIQIIAPFTNIVIHYPQTEEDINELFPEFIINNKPTYINLTREIKNV